MTKPSPYLRAVLLGFVTLGILALILVWSRRLGTSESDARFPTPEACLDAFRDAKGDGNAALYLRCLGEPLRSQTRRKYPDEQEMSRTLREEMQVVKSWGVKERPDSQARRGTVLVEEVRASGIRDLSFQLERTGDGWLIVAIEAGKERPASVPYGTVVGQEPQGK